MQYILERLINKQSVLIVKTFYQNRESVTQTVRTYRAILGGGRNEAPNESTVRRLMMKLKTTGSVPMANSFSSDRSTNCCCARRRVTVSAGKIDSPTFASVERLHHSFNRILHEDLHIHYTKFNLGSIFSHLTTGGGGNLLA